MQSVLLRYVVGFACLVLAFSLHAADAPVAAPSANSCAPTLRSTDFPSSKFMPAGEIRIAAENTLKAAGISQPSELQITAEVQKMERAYAMKSALFAERVASSNMTPQESLKAAMAEFGKTEFRSESKSTFMDTPIHISEPNNPGGQHTQYNLDNKPFLDLLGQTDKPIENRFSRNQITLSDGTKISGTIIMERPRGLSWCHSMDHKVTLSDAIKILTDLQKQGRVPATEANLQKFADAAYKYYNAMPFERGSAGLGRSWLTGVQKQIFGSNAPHIDGIDRYAMTMPQDAFVKWYAGKLQSGSISCRIPAASCLPQLSLGKVKASYGGLLPKGVVSNGLLTATRRLGTNGTAGIGYVGSKFCAFGMFMAQQQYEETAFLLSEYTLAVSGGAYRARLFSLFPDDDRRSYAESVQLSPFCETAECKWTWATMKDVTLFQPIDLETKFQTIVEQTLGQAKVVANVGERLDKVNSQIYALMFKDGDVTERDRILRAEQKKLTDGILIKKKKVFFDVEDPDRPGRSVNTWHWEVGWSVPMNPYTAADGTVVDPHQIDLQGLEDHELVFFQEADRGRLYLSTDQVVALRNIKYDCEDNCSGKGVGLEDIRSIWTDLYKKQLKRKEDAALAADAAKVQQANFACTEKYGEFKRAWNKVLAGISCPRTYHKDDEELADTIPELTDSLKGLSEACDGAQLRFNRSRNERLTEEYNKTARSAQGAVSFWKGFRDRVYDRCEEIEACRIKVGMTSGFDSSVEESADGRSRTVVLKKVPGNSIHAFSLAAEVDARFFTRGFSPMLQANCQDKFSSSTRGNACAEIFPEKDVNGGIYSQLVVVNTTTVCGKTIEFDFDIQGPRKKAKCGKLKIRFDCDEGNKDTGENSCLMESPPDAGPADGATENSSADSSAESAYSGDIWTDVSTDAPTSQAFEQNAPLSPPVTNEAYSSDESAYSGETGPNVPTSSPEPPKHEQNEPVSSTVTGQGSEETTTFSIYEDGEITTTTTETNRPSR